MTTFVDGPAAGQHLSLKRAPVFLRVVVADGGLSGPKWDALDQLCDTPQRKEVIYAYRIVGQPSMVHINRGRRGGSGFYQMAQYRLVLEQPSDAVMRSNFEWRAWCESRGER